MERDSLFAIRLKRPSVPSMRWEKWLAKLRCNRLPQRRAVEPGLQPDSRRGRQPGTPSGTQPGSGRRRRCLDAAECNTGRCRQCAGCRRGFANGMPTDAAGLQATGDAAGDAASAAATGRSQGRSLGRRRDRSQGRSQGPPRLGRSRLGRRRRGRSLGRKPPGTQPELISGTQPGTQPIGRLGRSRGPAAWTAGDAAWDGKNQKFRD